MPTALLSVSDKTNILSLASFLHDNKFRILSTGGTVDLLLNDDIPVVKISDYTQFSEILNGRVKTLHPKIYGGILDTNTKEDIDDKKKYNIDHIDVLVVNLYPFEKTIKTGNHVDCIENIDIGGVSLIRAGCKNYERVFVLTSPGQYDEFMSKSTLYVHNTDLSYRLTLACKGAKYISDYDNVISHWYNRLNKNLEQSASASASASTTTLRQKQNPEENKGNLKRVTKIYEHLTDLKYGCNPYQDKAGLYMVKKPPFEILHGNIGYINILDALNAWSLVFEIKYSINKDAAASFKHLSPAGVSIATDTPSFYTPMEWLYRTARDCDPKSSFGDFIAISGKVDVSLAKYIKLVVSDGIIALDYDPEALSILKTKKKGKYVILKGNASIINDSVEYREYKGFVVTQRQNTYIPSIQEIKAFAKGVSLPVIHDIIMSIITLKYTQSNSVGIAFNGRMVGIGAGQQSRIDCVSIARKKAELWFLRRFLPQIKDFSFKHIKTQEKLNAIIQYLEDDMSEKELERWKSKFIVPPQLLPTNEKRDCIRQYTNNKDTILCSDGFFPFRDSIDRASKMGIKYVVQPGGSIADKGVQEACDEYNMQSIITGKRLFHH